MEPLEDRQSTGSKKQWLVLYTTSRREKQVASRLLSLGLEVYCPLKKSRRRWSDRWKWVEEPLFQSYCFVRLAGEERQKVFQVAGVVRYLFWLGKPAVVREEEIDTLKSWLNDFDHSSIVVEKIDPKEQVFISSGPFINQRGEVISQQGAHLFLKMTGLGAIIKVSLKENRLSRSTD